jgi:hypothetical protein
LFNIGLWRDAGLRLKFWTAIGGFGDVLENLDGGPKNLDDGVENLGDGVENLE